VVTFSVSLVLLQARLVEKALKPMSLTLAQLGCDELREVHEAVGVAPFVVIPGNNLDLVAEVNSSGYLNDARIRGNSNLGLTDCLTA
jgi:hypothetical protein